MTKGELGSSTIFNEAVDSVVRYCISLTVEDLSSTHEELGMAVGRCMGMFYANGRMIVSRDPEWLQGTINVIIRLFRRVGLMDNVKKSKTMPFQPGVI